MSSSNFESAAVDFLKLKRIAVAGMSRTGKDTGSGIFRALRDRGYEVIPINPHADMLENTTCYKSLQEIPGGAEGVIIVTNPEATSKIIQDAAEAGTTYVWMHNNTLLPSSVSEEAVSFGEANGLTVIAGGCPMMFLDFGHKCLKWVLGKMGRYPEVVNFSKN